jgi:hypothetical protein
MYKKTNNNLVFGNVIYSFYKLVNQQILLVGYDFFFENPVFPNTLVHAIVIRHATMSKYNKTSMLVGSCMKQKPTTMEAAYTMGNTILQPIIMMQTCNL